MTSLPSASHPARGAWIEIREVRPGEKRCWRRTPQGVRGLKLVVPAQLAEDVLRRTPQGVRGLKLHPCTRRLPRRGRTPQGVRGLKFVMLTQTVPDLAVAPRKGCVD